MPQGGGDTPFLFVRIGDAIKAVFFVQKTAPLWRTELEK